MQGFLAELKRRNVIRVAALYLAASWLVLQITDVLGSLLGLSQWVGYFMVALVVLALPVVLAVAWVYELTPAGLVREDAAHIDPSDRRIASRRLNLITIAVALLAIAAVVVDRSLPEPQALETPHEPVSANAAAGATTAIAVLPFLNRSPDPQQEYFADGVAEEILTLLGKVEGLRVISQTSSFAFKNRNVPLTEIARQLGVAYLVEGSVRRVGDQVRISARMIDAAADRQLWAHDYERRLDDVFAIQSEVAGEVTKVLKIALGADELVSIGRAPTENLDAWQRFLKARQLLRDRRTESDVQEALALVEDAIRLDPEFARAHSLRAMLLLLRPVWESGSLEFEMQRASGVTPAEIARVEADWGEAIREAEVALQLDPRLGEPHAVRALHSLARNGYADAHRSFRWALGRAPSNPDIRNWYGSFLLDSGYVQSGLAEKLRAAELDPLSPMIAWQLAYAGIIAGRVDVVDSFVQKAGANGWPGWQANATHGGAALLRGDLAEAERRMIAAMPQNAAKVRVAFAAIRERRVDERTAAMLAMLDPYGPPGRGRYSTQVFAGDVDGALATIRATIDPDSLRSAGHAGPVRPAKGERPGSVLRADWWIALHGADVRSDPRFVALMEDIGLVDFWRQNGWPDHCRLNGDRVVCG